MSVDRSRIRLTTDVGEIFGIDGEEYELREGKIVTLPTANATPLLEKDAAVPADEADVEMSAASFMGGGHAAEDSESGCSSAAVGGPSPASADVGPPTSALPLGQLEALPPEKRRRLAQKRGLEWPTTDAARDRLEETIFDVIRHDDTSTGHGLLEEERALEVLPRWLDPAVGEREEDA